MPPTVHKRKGDVLEKKGPYKRRNVNDRFKEDEDMAEPMDVDSADFWDYVRTAEPPSTSSLNFSQFPQSESTISSSNSSPSSMRMSGNSNIGEDHLVADLIGELLTIKCNIDEHEEQRYATNIAAGTSENSEFDLGDVPMLVKQLSSPNDAVRDQAVLALGNIASDSPSCRDLVLSHGALIPLLSHLNEQADLSMLRNAAWALSNFCMGKPLPSFEQVRPALPALERLLLSNDAEILISACWALCSLSAGTNDKIQAVIEAGVCGRLVQLLLHPSPSVLISALHTVRNIVTGDDMQTQIVINHGSLECLLSLLTHDHNKNIKQEACRTVSNITAGNREQIQAVIEAGLIAPLVNLLQNAEFDIQKEAAWALSNAASRGTHAQIKYLVSQGCIKPLCDLLVCPDSKIIAVCLEGLGNFLKVGEAEKNFGNTGDVNLYAQMIDNNEGLEKIENLQSHDNSEIYEKAVNMLKTYWLQDDVETLPTGNDGSQLSGHT